MERCNTKFRIKLPLNNRLYLNKKNRQFYYNFIFEHTRRDLVHSCSHYNRLSVPLVFYCRFYSMYCIGKSENSKNNHPCRRLCGCMSSDQWSHDFSDLVDFQPNWNTSSFVRSFAIISMLCYSNHLFEENRQLDIDRYRLQMKFGLRLIKEFFDSPFVVQFMKFFCSSRLVIDTLQLWGLKQGLRKTANRGYVRFRRVCSFWSLSYAKASRLVIATTCTIYPSSYRLLSSMLVLARFWSAVFLNHIFWTSAMLYRILMATKLNTTVISGQKSHHLLSIEGFSTDVPLGIRKSFVVKLK